jgi:tRNA A-37 threonylcarbamoyl transferase component Bud32
VAIDTDILPSRYRDAEPIGRGAMGDIYRVTDALLGRSVAVKVLAERYAADEALRRRFRREALAAARLSGEPNIVTIYDVGEDHERPYLVMEYLSGGSLRDVLRREGAQPPRRVFAWLEQAARALDAAHRAGVVHRDVKPANLLLDRNDDVHVADFGIASAVGMDSLTVTGTVLGTAGYLAPEQAQGERATASSDRYALGIVAFELLTGERPFEAESPTAEASAHVHADVPSVCDRNGMLPCELDVVFEKALAKDPLRRHASCGEFVAALRDALADAAGATGRLAPVSPPTAATQRIDSRPHDTWPVPPREQHVAYSPPAVRRRRSPILLVALLVLGALAGALAAYFVTSGGNGDQAAVAPQPSVVTKTVKGNDMTTTIVSTTLPAAPTTAATVTTAPAATASRPASPTGTGAHALNDSGYAKMRGGDYAGALPVLQQAVQQLRGAGPSDPYEAYANYNLGYTLLHLDRCAEAIPYLRRAQQLEPQRPEPARDLARASACA